MRIGPASAADIKPYLEHLARHHRESGKGGAPLFSPYSADSPWDAEGKKEALLERWSKALLEPVWERAWAVVDEGRVVGHLDLRGDGIESMQHRARLGMGLEQAYRKRGVGTSLLEAAITWAREQPTLVWLDLGVFAHNEAALRLYTKCGFVAARRVNDLFRVDGQSIDDVHMVLKLR
jgi:RimJ/RimL family protein N-acetyltransferase